MTANPTVSHRKLIAIIVLFASLLMVVLVLRVAGQAKAEALNIERFETVLDLPLDVQERAPGSFELESGWQTVFSTTFEGDFPQEWVTEDVNPAGGLYSWGVYTGLNTTPAGSHSGWGVGMALSDTQPLAATGTYTDSVDAWAIAGPFDLSGAVDARLRFNAAISTELGVDYLGWAVSTDGQYFVGNQVSGGQGSWLSFEYDMQDFVDQPSVWIALRFTSDDNGVVGWGPFVDDLELDLEGGYHVYQPVVRKDTPATPTPSVWEDTFDDPTSGWPDDSGPIYWDDGSNQGVAGYWYRGYVDGMYRIYVEDAPCYTCDRFKQPDALGPFRPPSDKYCVETSLKFEVGSYWANMGLIFGADEENSTLYALCLSQDTDTEHLGWFIVRQDNYVLPVHGCYNSEFGIVGGDRSGTDLDGWNDLQISVDGNDVDVFIGGIYKGSYSLAGLSNMTRVGLIGGPAELLPVDVRARYFRVTPDVACTP